MSARPGYERYVVFDPLDGSRVYFETLASARTYADLYACGAPHKLRNPGCNVIDDPMGNDVENGARV